MELLRIFWNHGKKESFFIKTKRGYFETRISDIPIVEFDDSVRMEEVIVDALGNIVFEKRVK